MRAEKLFLGVGNVLRRDDGVGVRAAERMAGLDLPYGVEVVDAGTVGLEAATLLEGRQLVVVVDAIDAGATAGEIFRLTPSQLCPCVPTSFSLHQLHLLDALQQTQLTGHTPEQVVVYAVQAGDWSPGIGLSPAVEAALETVVLQAARELGLPASIIDHPLTTESAWAACKWQLS